MVYRLPAMQENGVRSLGQEDTLEKEMATHSSILACRIPWKRSLVGYIPRGHKELDMTEQLTDIHSKFIWFGNVLLLMESSLGQRGRYFGKLGRREQGDGAWWAAGGVCPSKPAHSPPQQREKGRTSFRNYSLGLTSDLMHSGVQDISWWISDIKLP